MDELRDSDSPLRIVLADDHAVVREGLKSLINGQPDMRVVGEAADGEAACRMTRELAPDVLVMDLSMPVLGGAEATERVRQENPSVKVLALTVHEERAYMTALLRAGATGYVLKRAAAAELVRAVRIVAAGGTYIDPAMAGSLVEGYLDGQDVISEPVRGPLSERERDVLMRIARGFSNKEIAAALGLSVKTVETYKARMTEKLGLRTRVEIVRYAAKEGWLEQVNDQTVKSPTRVRPNSDTATPTLPLLVARDRAQLAGMLEIDTNVGEAPATLARDVVRNRLLASLPFDEYERLLPYFERVRLEQRAVLFEPEEPIRYVYFPETLVVSLVSVMSQGETIEVGTAGSEGMAGLPLFLGDTSSSIRAFVQIPGFAMRMEATAFVRIARTLDAFHDVLLHYTQAFLTQVAQTAACNGVHLVEQRCARWLLMTHDRVADDLFPLTHEFLAFMLGVRRAGVTVAMRNLQDAGLVQYTRGSVKIVDRARLQAASCECYGIVRAHMDRMLPRTA